MAAIFDEYTRTIKRTASTRHRGLQATLRLHAEAARDLKKAYDAGRRAARMRDDPDDLLAVHPPRTWRGTVAAYREHLRAGDRRYLADVYRCILRNRAAVAAIHRQMRAGAGHRRARALRRSRGTWGVADEDRYQREQGADVDMAPGAGMLSPIRSDAERMAAAAIRREENTRRRELEDSPVRQVGGFQDPRLGDVHDYDVRRELGYGGPG